jgi:squalene-hopene/tetraprenyl-beta-curcumene cyclase
MTLSLDENALGATVAALQARLLAARGPHGCWEGHLSSSALSTATAVFALATVDCTDIPL